MGRSNPLLTVLKLAKDAEEQASTQLKAAQLERSKRQQQLDALNGYRLDYMQQLSATQGKQITANYYQQFHRFIKQIDEAVAQQVQSVAKASSMLESRRLNWLEKQQKRKAVELLLEQQAAKQAAKAALTEQKLLDEFALGQFVRRR